jgi:hypothetical protein
MGHFLSPLRGFGYFSGRSPTACAVGCILSPLRGLSLTIKAYVRELVPTETRPYRQLVRTETRPYRETCRLPRTCRPTFFARWPVSSDCLDEVNGSAVTDVTNVAIQIQIGN